MMGFYALAASLTGGLLWLAWADLTEGRRIHPKLVLACALGAGAILKGCLFVGGTWEAPGPEITREEHPRLFAFIDDVAASMGARMPEAVYLIPDVNAFVAEVGGFMGMFGTRRVMAIGVGMLNTDSISQLRATLAHEFGHFQGGDTRLGGFLYRTRASIGRVIGALGGGILGKPFEWYGTLFMRLTTSIARRQELAADAFSVAVAGRKAHMEGLKREAVAGAMFHGFMDSEVTPVLESGRRPHNVFDGFRAYLANLGADGVLTRVESSLHGETTDPYDTHPALADRLAYALGLPDSAAKDEPALSRTLLEQPDDVESRITGSMLNDQAKGFEAVAWGDVPKVIYAARHGRYARKVDEALGTSDSSVAAMLAELGRGDVVGLARKLAPEALEGASTEETQGISRDLVTAFCSARIHHALAAQAGWSWQAEPGRSVVVVGPEGRVVDGAELIRNALVDGAQLEKVKETLASLGVA